MLEHSHQSRTNAESAPNNKRQTPTEYVERSDVGEQTAQTIENLTAILEAAGTSLDDVLKANVYVTDMDDYEAVNEVYAEYMSEPYPARAAVEVSRLPIDIAVEIEVVAAVE